MNSTIVLKPGTVKNTVRVVSAAALLTLALTGCSIQVPIPEGASSPAPSAGSGTTEAPNPESTAVPTRPAVGGKLNAANDNLSWANGQKLLGDEHGGYTPDFSNKMADPESGWVMDASRISEGAMVFTSKTTKCVVRTYQNRLAPTAVVQGDDRTTSANVLALIFHDDLASVQKNSVDITLGYGSSDRHSVTLLATTTVNRNGYFFAASRAFSKLGVVLVVDSVCPTAETRGKTMDAIRESITINGN